MALLQKVVFQLSHGIKNIYRMFLYNCYFQRFVSRFDSDAVKELEVYFVLYVFFAFIEKKRPNEYCV